jgi:TolB protein
VKPDGSNNKMVGSFKYPATDFSLSPDETQIAFRTRTINGRGDISIADVDGSNQRVVLSTEMEDINPVWSPDGKKIMFTRHDGDHSYSLMMMNPDGTGVERLVPDLKSARFLEFEPKGNE